MPSTTAERTFRIFYRDYANGVAISSLQSEPLPADRVAPMARTVLQHADNFFGVVDREDAILQLALDDDDASMIVELLYPESQGMLRRRMPREQAFTLLSDLPDPFHEGLLPGAQYIS